MTDPQWKLEKRPRRPIWVRLAISAAALWATIVITMVIFEESMIFFPDRYPSGNWDVEAVARGSGTSVEDCFFEAADGTRLHGWWCRPEVGGRGVEESTAEMVLLWFHGNAGNLAQRSDLMIELASIPVQVLIVDYRGYGRSAGRPSEKGLYRDARAAWRFLLASGVEADRIVILGKSLGGAVAVDLAAEVTPAGLIVESSFTSVPEMAIRHYPFVPRWFVRTKMDSRSKIGGVDCPIMVIHSPDDEIVPFDHGRQLYQAASGDRRFYEVSGAYHNELWLVAGADYLRAIREFLLHCRGEGRDAQS